MQLTKIVCMIFIISLTLTSCNQVADKMKSQSVFTYSTYQGGIYNQYLPGDKHEIVPPDGILKEDLKWSPNGAQLAFVTTETGQNELTHTLWVVNADGSNLHSLFGPAKALRFSWEKESDSIYLEEAISFQRIPFDKDTTIRAYQINSKSHSIQEVMRKSDLFPPPNTSPDEKRSTWIDPADSEPTLYLLDEHGNKLSAIYKFPPDQWTKGTWSPDSQQLAILRDNEIYLYLIATGSWVQVSSLASNHDGYLVTDIQWSPDGKWLSYMINDKKLINGICVLNIAERAEKCFDAKWSSNAYAWDQDSRYVAYLGKTLAGEADIFVIDVQEGTIKNLTQDGNNAIETSIAR